MTTEKMQRVLDILRAQGHIWLAQIQAVYISEAAARNAAEWLVRTRKAKLTTKHGYYEEV